MIQTALAGKGSSGGVGPAVYAAIMCPIAAVSAWSAKETSNTSIDDLDNATG